MKEMARQLAHHTEKTKTESQVQGRSKAQGKVEGKAEGKAQLLNDPGLQVVPTGAGPVCGAYCLREPVTPTPTWGVWLLSAMGWQACCSRRSHACCFSPVLKRNVTTPSFTDSRRGDCNGGGGGRTDCGR